MNDRRKNVNWHITIPGHEMLPVPDADALFYCYETGDVNGTPHTHIGFRARVPICKRDLLFYLRSSHFYEVADEERTKQLLESYNPDLRAHQNWKTIVGYHYGGGDKPACPNPIWVVGSGDPKDIHFPGRWKQAAKSKLLLDTRPRDAVDEGLIPLERIKHLADAQKLYHSLRPKPVLAVGDFIPTVWPWHSFAKTSLPFRDTKLRHFWFFSEHSNAGKTTFARELRKYGIATATHDFRWWRCEPNFQFVLLDAFRPWVERDTGKYYTMPFQSLETLCDGNYAFDIKCEPVLLADHNYIVVILSNQSPHEAYGQEKDPYIRTRFLVFSIDISGNIHEFYD